MGGGERVPFPDEDLEVTVRAAFGADLTQAPTTWTWTDLSSRLLDNPISIQRGIIVGGRTSRSTSGTLTLLNDDGALTPHHPGSNWWPYVDAGTPLDVAVRTSTTPILQDSFTRTVVNSWGTADTPAVAWTHSNTTAFNTTGTTATVSFTTVNVTRRARVAITHRDIDMVSDFTMPAVAAGAAVTTGHYFRGNAGATEWLWSALDFSTAGVVSLRLRSGLVDLASAAIPGGLTYTGGTKIRLRTLAIGDRIRIKAWLASGSEPTAWAIDHTVDVLTGANTHLGILSWVLAGNTNTLPYTMSFDDLTVTQPRYPRLEGYITDIQPVFIPVGDDTFHSAVQVSVGGVGTVLDVRGADEWSPMRRSIQYGVTPPHAYWHCEDGDRATSAASGVVGQPPLQVTGPAVFSFDTGEPDDVLLERYGSKNLCSLAAGAKLTSAFTPSSVQTGWTVGITAQVTAAAVPVSEIRVLEWATSGTYTRWALVSTATGHSVRAYNDTAGTATTVCSSVEAINTLVGMDVQCEQSGGNILVRLLIDATVYASGSIAGTLGAPFRVDVNPDRANTTASTNPFGIRWLAGHITVWPSPTASSLPYYFDGPTLYRSDRAWHQEPSHLRVRRQCVEGRVPFRQIGTTRIPTLLNAQQEGATVDLVTASVDAQSGALLFEDEFGYALLDRSSRYNRPVALTIDLATYRRSDGTDAAEVLQPVLAVRSPTVWTVERTNGSQAVWAASAAYRKRRGEIGAKATLDLLSDADTLPHARWRVHLTEDAADAHYPGASVDLAANPDLLDAWLLVRIGDRVQRLNQPTIAGVGTIDQVVEGMSETLTRRSWTAAVDAAPYTPWRAAVQGVSVQQPYGTTLQSALNVSATSFTLVTQNPINRWSTTAAVTIDIDGEHITIPAAGIAAAVGTGPVTQTVTGAIRAVNGIPKSHLAGAVVTLADPDWLAL
jgi:hypothetical protein